jgi:hypothetical protein
MEKALLWEMGFLGGEIDLFFKEMESQGFTLGRALYTLLIFITGKKNSRGWEWLLMV